MVPAPPIVPEPPIVHELIDGLVHSDTMPPDGNYSDPDPQIPPQPTIDAQSDLVATMAPEPLIVTPIVTPIPIYPTANDHLGLPHTIALSQLDQLTKLLAQVTQIADSLRTSIATMAIDSISGASAPGDADVAGFGEV
jgi:hypothetical protein